MTDININEVYEELKYLGELPETSRLIKGYLALHEENERLRAIITRALEELRNRIVASVYDGTFDPHESLDIVEKAIASIGLKGGAK